MTRMTLLHDLPSIDPDKLHAIDVEALVGLGASRHAPVF